MNSLKYWRQEVGLSQFELAESAGVARHVIQLAEQSIRLPRDGEQVALSEALGVPLSKLFPSVTREDK